MRKTKSISTVKSDVKFQIEITKENGIMILVH